MQCNSCATVAAWPRYSALLEAGCEAACEVGVSPASAAIASLLPQAQPPKEYCPTELLSRRLAARASAWEGGEGRGAVGRGGVGAVLGGGAAVLLAGGRGLGLGVKGGGSGRWGGEGGSSVKRRQGVARASAGGGPEAGGRSSLAV